MGKQEEEEEEEEESIVQKPEEMAVLRSSQGEKFPAKRRNLRHDSTVQEVPVVRTTTSHQEFPPEPLAHQPSLPFRVSQLTKPDKPIKHFGKDVNNPNLRLINYPDEEKEAEDKNLECRNKERERERERERTEC
ncbi:hypothetical protein RUM43_009356 [Polyplax serrata]|uniref:Uncharacterized protein n=1 Tax=Polyplax serrata TaxID=468196 RepID=A0AAN8PWA7_POLSC